jgi:DNA-binding XRE family transcriptional regulator
MAIGRHCGRPRSTWIGKFGAFISDFTPERLACELELDDQARIYHWARGDNQPSIRTAIAIVELARARGMALSLEDIYGGHLDRIRARFGAQTRARVRELIQASVPPSLSKAIAIVEIARSAGADLSLEDIYSGHRDRIRARIRSGQPPL